MSLFRYTTEPFVTFDDIARVFDDAMTGHTGTGSRQVARSQTSQSFWPRTDVHDGPNNTLVASFELPGLKKEDISIELHNNQLTVSGEVKHSSEKQSPEGTAEGQKYFVRERRYGAFSRTIPLPEGTQAESVKAAVNDGVLTVTFPKATPEQAPKKITIA